MSGAISGASSARRTRTSLRSCGLRLPTRGRGVHRRRWPPGRSLMLLYIAKRLVLVVPVVFAVALVCFLLVHIAPGDPLISVLPPDASQALADQVRKASGFDRPLPVQFGIWAWKAVNGDLGTSIATGRAVAEEVTRAVGNTVMLALFASLIGFVFGLTFGFLAGYFRDTWVDKLVTTISITGVSMPHYWLGMVLVIIFSVQLGWLPAVVA